MDLPEAGRAPAELPEALTTQFPSSTKLSAAVPIPKKGLGIAFNIQ